MNPWFKMCHLLVRVQVMKNEKRTPNWFSQPALFKLTLCVLATCCKLVLLSLMIMRMAAALFANMHDHTWQNDSSGAHPAPQQQNDRTTACIIAKKLDRQQHDVRIPKHSPWHVASCHVPEAHTLEVQTRVCALQRRPGYVCTCGVTVVRNCECTIRACPVCAHEKRCSCLAWNRVRHRTDVAVIDVARLEGFPSCFVCDGDECLREIDCRYPHFDSPLMICCLVWTSESRLIFRLFLVESWI